MKDWYKQVMPIDYRYKVHQADKQRIWTDNFWNENYKKLQIWKSLNSFETNKKFLSEIRYYFIYQIISYFKSNNTGYRLG